MLRIGQKVVQEFGTQVMEVIGFAPQLVENVFTRWEDEQGTVITGKFMERQLAEFPETYERGKS